MGYAFLSDDWFTEMERIRADIGEIEVPEPARGLKINLEISGGPGDQTVLAHLGEGAIHRGAAEGAPTKIRAPYEVVRKMIVERDQGAAMQAFMSGQIQVEGDLTKLMGLQSATGTVDPKGQKLLERILEMTE